MRIEITEAEITAGVRQALQSTLGLKLEGKGFNVKYSMGRGKNGLSGVAIVTDSSTPVAATETKSTVVIPGVTDSDAPEDKAPAVEVADTSTATEAAEPDLAAVAGDEDLFNDD